MKGKIPFALIIVYPLLFIWQGLDFTDTGYVLANYRQIFHDPASVGASFKIWLTDIIGGVWISLFGDSLGLIGYRLAAVLLVYATLYFSFLILKPHIKTTNLLWGLFLALIFINRSGYHFNYNSMTAFFYVAALYFLIKGLQSEKKQWIYTSAFLAGLNIFVRLPNVLDLLLILGIFFHGYLCKRPMTEQLKLAFRFFLGYLAAILAVFAAMKLMGHFEIYIEVLKGTIAMLNDPSGHHSSGLLKTIFVRDFELVYQRAGTTLLGLVALAIVLTGASRIKSKLLPYAIIATATLVHVYLYFEYYLDWNHILATVLGAVYLVLFLEIIKTGDKVNQYSLNKDNLYCGNQEFRTISFLALVTLALVPLGSNNGIVNSVYGMYLALPLAFDAILRPQSVHLQLAEDTAKVMEKYHLRLSREEVTFLRAVAILILLTVTLNSAWHYTFRDAENRPALNSGINHSKLKGIITTKERARVVEELLRELPRYVREDDYLLAYEQISMVYFLTETSPYLYSSWPMLYNPKQLRQALEKALREKPSLPVVVRAKGDTENFEWPRSKSPLINKGYYKENRRIMNGFIRENNYRTAWENSFFEILVADK